MRTMSLWESGDSTGDVSLGELFAADNEVDGTSNLDIRRIAFLVCREDGRRLRSRRTRGRH